MLDWKILAASIVALLFISSVFIGGLGVSDIFSEIIGKTGDYLGSTPFDGLFPSTTSSASDKEVKFTLTPETITITPDSGSVITSGDTIFSGYDGDIIIDFEESKVQLVINDLTVDFPLELLEINELVLESFMLEETSFEINPEIKTQSGIINMKNFNGQAIATVNGLVLEGTSSSLIVTIGETELEVV